MNMRKVLLNAVLLQDRLGGAQVLPFPFQQLDELGDTCCSPTNIDCVGLAKCLGPFQGFVQKYEHKLDHCMDSTKWGCDYMMDDKPCFDKIKHGCLDDAFQWTCIGTLPSCVKWATCAKYIDCADMFLDFIKLPPECNDDIRQLVGCKKMMPCLLDDWNCLGGLVSFDSESGNIDVSAIYEIVGGVIALNVIISGLVLAIKGFGWLCGNTCSSNKSKMLLLHYVLYGFAILTITLSMLSSGFQNNILSLLTMLAMFTTVVVMVVCLTKYDRHMPPIAIMSFMAVIIQTMMAYMLQIVSMVAILGDIYDYHAGVIASIFYLAAIFSILITTEGKRSGKIIDARNSFKQKQGFFERLF